VPAWSLAAYQAIRAKDGYADPLMASRWLAMMHIAMHDAVNAAAPALRAACADGARLRRRCLGRRGGGGAWRAWCAFCPDQKPMLDAELAMVTAEAGRGPAVERGERRSAPRRRGR
jgi:hypothetical protein